MSASQPLILVVDDEPQIQRFLRPALTAAGYRVFPAMDGRQALRQAATQPPALIILDLGLPDLDGKDVLAALRKISLAPIIILSARDREAEKIAALDLGANDFVNKPFGIGELLARLRVALRQGHATTFVPGPLRAGPLCLDNSTHRVTREGVHLHLTPKEFQLLEMLMRNAGRVLTHRMILGEIWGPAHVADTQYLRVFIGQLRQKIEDDASQPRMIHTEPGIGYRFAPE